MTKGTEAVLKQALGLGPEERAELIEGIFLSLDDVSAQHDDLWISEAEARIDAYATGRISADSAEEVFRRLLKS